MVCIIHSYFYYWLLLSAYHLIGYESGSCEIYQHSARSKVLGWIRAHEKSFSRGAVSLLLLLLIPLLLSHSTFCIPSQRSWYFSVLSFLFCCDVYVIWLSLVGLTDMITTDFYQFCPFSFVDYIIWLSLIDLTEVQICNFKNYIQYILIS